MQNLWLATHNSDKIKEFKILFKNTPFILKNPNPYFPPAETGSSFIENAKIKYFSLKKKKPSSWILAEDSGIEIQFLKNQPGVYSARWLGENISWRERLEGLLNQMKTQKRQAQMVSVIMFGRPDGKWIQAQGVIQGTISYSIKGSHGFGYDFVFIPKGEKKTMGELGYPYKNQYSHRFLSVNELKKQFPNFINS